MVNVRQMRVVKRDGDTQEFDPEKITRAVFLATKQLGYDIDFASWIMRQTLEDLGRYLDPSNIEYKLRGIVHPHEIDFEFKNLRVDPSSLDNYVSTSLIHEAIIRCLKKTDYIAGERYGVYMRGRRASRKHPHYFPLDLVTNTGVTSSLELDTIEWYTTHKCDTLERLVDRMANPHTRSFLIQESESHYEAQVAVAALTAYQKIIDGARIIIVSGPSSSSKTTTAMKILKRVMQTNAESKTPLDIEILTLPGDDFFYSLDDHPKLTRSLVDGSGRAIVGIDGQPVEMTVHNYETIYAMKVWTLRQAIVDLLEHGYATIEQYDMRKGQSKPSKVLKASPGKTTILLFDSLHGTDPVFYDDVVDPNLLMRISVDAHYHIHDGEKLIPDTLGRLGRRCYRDLWARSKDIFETLMGWDIQGRGVEYIRSRANLAHATVNGGHPYDILVMGAFIMDHFRNNRENYPKTWFYEDFFPTSGIFAYTPSLEICHSLGMQLHNIVQRTLGELPALNSEVFKNEISPSSNIREFIGGYSE